MLVDITERKRAEETLRESEERFRAIVETTPECVKLVAADGRLLLMNEAGLEMVGAAGERRRDRQKRLRSHCAGGPRQLHSLQSARLRRRERLP